MKDQARGYERSRQHGGGRDGPRDRLSEQGPHDLACRHEAGAANMAEAYGKLTGKPGVCMVTRGPGATHASIGVHTAHQDSTPMILFVGQIALTDRGRGAFQEVDYREVFGGLAKWATEIESPERTVEVVERAFATALQGRMGPVVIALPEDILHADGGPAPIRPVTPAKAASWRSNRATSSPAMRNRLRVPYCDSLCSDRRRYSRMTSASSLAFSITSGLPDAMALTSAYVSAGESRSSMRRATVWPFLPWEMNLAFVSSVCHM